MSKKWLGLAALLVIGIAGAAVVMRQSQQDQMAQVSAAPEKPAGVGARGRIAPEDGVVVVAAPYFGGRPSIVKELRVKEGDRVQAGQMIGILDGYFALEKAVAQSEADVEVARK